MRLAWAAEKAPGHGNPLFNRGDLTHYDRQVRALRLACYFNLAQTEAEVVLSFLWFERSQNRKRYILGKATAISVRYLLGIKVEYGICLM